MKIRTTDRWYDNCSILVTTEWKNTTDHSYNNWSILVTTEWKTQLIDFSHNWIKNVLLIDHVTTDQFYSQLNENTQ